MKVHILASGSAGNATCIEMGDSRFLLDAGISARRLKQGLSEVGILPESIDGIFITHEHIDHIKGLSTFTKKYRTPVFGRRDTFLAMGCRMELPQECIRVLPERMVWQDIEVSRYRHFRHCTMRQTPSATRSRSAVRSSDLRLTSDSSPSVSKKSSQARMCSSSRRITISICSRTARIRRC